MKAHAEISSPRRPRLSRLRLVRAPVPVLFLGCLAVSGLRADVFLETSHELVPG